MRPMVFIPLFILFASCSGQQLARFIPEDFTYPNDSIGEGKTFIFHDSVHNKNTYLALRSFMQGSDTVQSRVRYDAMSVIDSQIISHGQMIESYYQFSWYHPILYKGQDLIDVTTSDGTKLGLNNTSCTYHNDTLLLTISSESQFLKDTSMVWSGRLVPCLVIVSNGKMEARSKTIESLNFTSTILVRGYYAKDLGVIKYTLTFRDRKNNDQFLVWDLVAIEDGRKIIARGVN